jgi:uncharacterized small protein (DUF1192 family)
MAASAIDVDSEEMMQSDSELVENSAASTTDTKTQEPVKLDLAMLLAEIQKINNRVETESKQMRDFVGSELSTLSNTCEESSEAVNTLAEVGMSQKAAFYEAVNQFKQAREQLSLQLSVTEMQECLAKLQQPSRSLSAEREPKASRQGHHIVLQDQVQVVLSRLHKAVSALVTQLTPTGVHFHVPSKPGSAATIFGTVGYTSMFVGHMTDRGDHGKFLPQTITLGEGEGSVQYPINIKFYESLEFRRRKWFASRVWTAL